MSKVEEESKRRPFDPKSLQVPYGDWAAAVEILEREGVVVLTGALGDTEVAALRGQLEREVKEVCPSVDFAKPTTWKAEHLPPQTRPGMFQNTLGNLPAVWSIRSHPRFVEAFRRLHTGIRKVDDPADLGPIVTSVDGLTIKPPTGPFYTPPSASQAAEWPGSVNWAGDWAHTDQTAGHYSLNIQGQAVLTQTTAGFVCSTRSHTMLKRVCEMNSVKPSPRRGWNKLKSSVYEPVARLVREAGGHFQVPVNAPRGAMVFWFSSTIHAAKYHDTPTKGVTDDWRMVVYVCHRPLLDVGSVHKRRAHRDRLQQAYKENRLTNHSGDKMFAKNPSFRFSKVTPDASIAALVKNPAAVYDLAGLRPPMNATIASLLDLPDPTAPADAPDANPEPAVGRVPARKRKKARKRTRVQHLH